MSRGGILYNKLLYMYTCILAHEAGESPRRKAAGVNYLNIQNSGTENVIKSLGVHSSPNRHVNSLKFMRLIQSFAFISSSRYMYICICSVLVPSFSIVIARWNTWVIFTLCLGSVQSNLV